MAAVAALLAVALGAGLWWGAKPTSPVPIVPIARGATPSIEVDRITVHVAGAVRRPGLVQVAIEARVADAVAAAGGAVPDAELAGLNLAAPIRDGDQIVVPFRTDAGLTSGSIAATAADSRVRINRATEQELQLIPGVGPVLAGRIVAHRDQYGPFEVLEDLLDVPGIGEAKLAAMRDAVIVP
jgi:competence protein ComEA